MVYLPHFRLYPKITQPYIGLIGLDDFLPSIHRKFTANNAEIVRLLPDLDVIDASGETSKKQLGSLAILGDDNPTNAHER